ncbi:MAG TPA: 3-keto-5-aminohexanoate cleavage protein [Rhizomicrobium sp.]
MGKTWLEVALNGGLTRESQPHVPVSVEEIVADGIACVKAGAAIVHVHSYDVATGRQKDDADLYARIIDGIRSQVDAIVYPTVIGGTRGGSEVTVVGPERYAAVKALAERGLLEWTVCDPGSTNIALYAGLSRGWKSSVYVNTESDIRTGLALAEEHGLVPSYAIYEPGFLRLGAALAEHYPSLKTPVYRFMFSDRMTFGFAPRDYALDAYLAMLQEYAAGAPWMIAGLMVDVTPLMARTVAAGGHVRVGLEDAHHRNERTNVQFVEAAEGDCARRRIARDGGRGPRFGLTRRVRHFAEDSEPLLGAQCRH